MFLPAITFNTFHAFVCPHCNQLYFFFYDYQSLDWSYMQIITYRNKMKTITNIYSTYVGDIFKEKLIGNLYYDYCSHYYGKYLYKKPGFSLGHVTRTPHSRHVCLLEHHNTIFQHSQHSLKYCAVPNVLDQVETLLPSSSSNCINLELGAVIESSEELYGQTTDNLTQIPSNTA